MRKILPAIALLFSAYTTVAQNGLENLLVEKYYIAEPNDTNANIDGGVLPLGSVTYRLYADMLPGYKFQAVYGVPGHEMRIETTTLFFNNEDRGSTTPTFSKTNARNNTVMLDSWLSVGAACSNNFGILKSADDGAATIVNNYSPMVLQSTNPLAGIPVMQEDGIISVAGRNPEPVTDVGISTEIAVFNDQNDGTNGPVFATSNGSWASLNGSVGADTIDNKVLIAQITTDGVLCFKLNIQIGTPAGGVENYVADSAVASEILFAPLVYCSNTGISSHDKQNNFFKIYPNPTNSNTYIQIKDVEANTNSFYTISDITGKVVLQKELGFLSKGQIIKIDATQLQSGYYFVSLHAGNNVATQKLVKK